MLAGDNISVDITNSLPTSLFSDEHTLVKIEEQFDASQSDLAHARQKQQNAQDGLTVLSRLHDNAVTACRQTPRAKEDTTLALQFQESICATANESQNTISANLLNDPQPETEGAVEEYRAHTSRAVEMLNSKLSQLAGKEQTQCRRRDALLAAKQTIEAELGARAARVASLEELMKAAAAELQAFNEAHLQAFKRGLEKLEAGRRIDL
ncbi:hypothetical protein H2199_008980 [Coniosporium tulheliwenetii]|uniref:Uncharacterized protein n=1 Tax=Coniosporium tulheliwenetii TaxID=3383036 RepID=A0ACC2YGX9_9PEZI|nr:hypothetical protein H2199_008980 [Cladosporium sp. JES 115]